jgi:hypothetical protein
MKSMEIPPQVLRLIHRRPTPAPANDTPAVLDPEELSAALSSELPVASPSTTVPIPQEE